MSTTTQTPPRVRPRFGPRFALSMAAAVGIVALAIGPYGRDIAAMAMTARPHAPDLTVFAALSPAVKIHLITALAALVLGAALMWARKGRVFHRIAGWTWVGLVATTAGVTLLITEFNHGAWSWLHLFTGWTLLILPLGVIAARRRQIAQHRKTMMGLFYGAFAINLIFAAMPGRTLWAMVMG